MRTILSERTRSILKELERLSKKEATPLRAWTIALGNWFIFGLAVVAAAKALSGGLLWAPVFLLAVLVGTLAYTRSYLVLHECGHRIWCSNIKQNDIIGELSSWITLTPFVSWARSDHLVHHKVSQLLGMPLGQGDPLPISLKSFLSLSLWKRRLWAVLFNPIVFFVFPTPVGIFLGLRRTNSSKYARTSPAYASIVRTNCAFVVTALLLGHLGTAYVLSYLAIFSLSSSAGVLIFFVQHIFPRSLFRPKETWEWELAVLRGSSTLLLPRVLQGLLLYVTFHCSHHLRSGLSQRYLRDAFEAIRSEISLDVIVLTERERSRILELGCQDRIHTLRQVMSLVPIYDEDRQTCITRKELSELCRR